LSGLKKIECEAGKEGFPNFLWPAQSINGKTFQSPQCTHIFINI